MHAWSSILVAAAALPPAPDALVAVPEPTAKALQYFRGNQILWIVNTILGLAIPALFLFTGWSAKLRDVARRLGKWWYPSLVIYLAFFTILTTLITLPLDFWSGFTRQHEYGLSNQTLGKWWRDFGIGMAVSLVLGGLVIWVPYLLIRKSPRRWWLWTGVVAIPGSCLVILLSPILIDPLFNKFGPMQDKALEQKILALAERAGIEGSRVYEVAKSEDTKAVNAYVTGFMGTKRIVLWDTTIAKLDERQLLFVMGHEMGHFVLGHIWKSIALAGAGIAFVLWLASRMERGLIARYQDRFRFADLGDFASLPLILLIVNVIGIFTTPAALAYSRWQEHDADRFGLEITRDNWAGGSAFVKLQEENLGVPRPGLLYKILRSSHPPLGERVDFCNAYKPWTTGEPMRHASKFKEALPTPP